MACSKPCASAAAGCACWTIIWSGLTRVAAGSGSRPLRAACLRRELERHRRAAQRGRIEADRHARAGTARLSADGPRTLHAHPRPASFAAGRSQRRGRRRRGCACATTRLGLNPGLAGLKTLNRLESVLARSEWSDARIWEGLMRDVDENVVCGTMSNLFLRRGSDPDDAGARSLRCGRRDAPLDPGERRRVEPARDGAPPTLAGLARRRGGVHEQCRRRIEIGRGDRARPGAPAAGPFEAARLACVQRLDSL